MTSLLEQLSAKTRRHVVVPVEVTAASDEQNVALGEAEAAVLRAITAGEPIALREAQEALDAARGLNRANVAFTALDSTDFEKVAAAYPSPEGKDAGMDWAAALPVLAALCADDPELQDDDVWKALLPAWSHGERLALWGALLRLNTLAPEPYVPKG